MLTDDKPLENIYHHIPLVYYLYCLLLDCENSAINTYLYGYID